MLNVALEVQILAEGGIVRLMTRYNSTMNYAAILDTASSTLELTRAGIVVQSLTVPLAVSEWHVVRLTTYENTVEIFLNGVLMLAFNDDAPLPPGGLAIESGLASNSSLIDNVIVFIPALDLNSSLLESANIVSLPMYIQPFSQTLPPSRLTFIKRIVTSQPLLMMRDRDGQQWQYGGGGNYQSDTFWTPDGGAVVVAQGNMLNLIFLTPHTVEDAISPFRNSLNLFTGRIFRTSIACPQVSPTGRYVSANLFVRNELASGSYIVNADGTSGGVPINIGGYCGVWGVTQDAEAQIINEQIASIRGAVSQITGLFQADIFIYDPDQPNALPVRVTDDPLGEFDLSWSPDGTKLVYSAYVDGDAELFMLDLSVPNSQPQQLTNNDSSDLNPVWSPNSQQIVFQRTVNLENGGLWLMNVINPASEYALVNSHVWDENPDWSQDGQWLAVASRRTGGFDDTEIFALPVNGGEPVRITDDNHDDSLPQWERDRCALVATEACEFYRLASVSGLPLPFTGLPYLIDQADQQDACNPLGARLPALSQRCQREPTTRIQAFGPTSYSFAFDNTTNQLNSIYNSTFGIHSGLDFGGGLWRQRVVISVCDGVVVPGNWWVIVNNQPTTPTGGSAQPGRGVSVRCFMEPLRSNSVNPRLSNIIVTYNHMLWCSSDTENSAGENCTDAPMQAPCTALSNIVSCSGRYSLPRVGDVVYMGTPLGQTGATAFDHLHLAVHFATDFARVSASENSTYLNPLPMFRSHLVDVHRLQPYFPWYFDVVSSRYIVSAERYGIALIGDGSGIDVSPSELGQWSGGVFASQPNGDDPNFRFLAIQVSEPEGPNQVEWPNGYYPLNTHNANSLNFRDAVEYLSSIYSSLNFYQAPVCNISIDNSRGPLDNQNTRLIADVGLSNPCYLVGLSAEGLFPTLGHGQ
ncbi:MAG: hypothetical protein SF123_07090 [Chloroflexota bacterium]|nr:hypothetical protein [Chloroflexota bacterium]